MDVGEHGEDGPFSDGAGVGSPSIIELSTSNAGDNGSDRGGSGRLLLSIWVEGESNVGDV